jgi:hypothetical protein
MANKEMFKQAIAEAKSVREAAIANAKEALEETLTPHLKDMLAAKLQEMEDKESKDEEVVTEVEDEKKEDYSKDKKDEALAEDFTTEEEEVEDDSEESEDEAPESGEEEIEDIEVDAEVEGGEEINGDEDLSKLSVDQFKDMIRDIIAQEVGAGESGEEELGLDMDGGDIEGMGDEAPIEEPGMEPELGVDDAPEDDEIDLDELLRELEGVASQETPVSEDTAVEVPAESETKDKNINRTLKEDLKDALTTIETLRTDLQEVNLLNSKLLYVNKIFKSSNLAESQKVNIIAAFDKAETVKEVKLVFETVSENVVTTKKGNVTESKIKGLASKATGTTASREVISEVSDTVRRMQKLAGIIK